MQASPGHASSVQLLNRLLAVSALLDESAAGNPPSLRDCWRASSELRALAAGAGMPVFARLVRHMASGFAHRAGSDAPLDACECDLLARWFALAADAINGSASVDSLALLPLLSQVDWLPPLGAALADAAWTELPLEIRATAANLDRTSAAMSAEDATATSRESVDCDNPVGTEDDPASDPALAEPSAMDRASALLTGLDVDLDGLTDDEILALANALALPDMPADSADFAAVAPIDVPAFADTAATAAHADRAFDTAAVSLLSDPADDALAAAHALLALAGVDSAGLADDDVLALADAFSQEAAVDDALADNTFRPVGIDEGSDAAAFAVGELSSPQPELGVLAMSDSPMAEAESTGDIWIAPEELELTRAAISEQILTQAIALVGAGSPAERAVAQDDLAFQLSLVGNAMELLGTPALCALLQRMSEHAASANPDAECLMQVSAALLAFLDAPGLDGAPMLTAVAEEAGFADADWSAAFAGECARLRLGMDPARIAARKRDVEPDDVELLPAADVLPNVLDSMLRELPGNAGRLGESVRLMVATGDTAPIDEARRVAHTLKGDANTVGVRGLANLTHALEDALIELLKSPDRLDASMGRFLLEAADMVEECADHLLGRGPVPVGLAAIYQQALDWSNALFEGAPAPRDAEQAEPRVAEQKRMQASMAVALDRQPPAAAAPVKAVENATTARTLAVDTALLDELQRLAGELLVLGRQVEQRLAMLSVTERELRVEVEGERGIVSQLDDLVALRGAALQSAALSATDGVDALELDQYNELHNVSRRLTESNADNVERVRQVERALIDLEPLTVQQQRLNDEIQRVIGQTRTMPFREIVPRLQRVVRQTARQLDRPVDLTIKGEAIGIDADMLERLVEPMSHLLRNAIDHGVEPAERRRAAGKPVDGAIHIDVSVVGDSAVIVLGDDGRGLDLVAIRAKAEHLGMIEPSAQLADDAIARLVLAAGFSTRDAVSQVSGRGVGMDVVNQRIRELRGTLALHSTPGRGTSVTLRLPLSRTLADVIVVAGHGLTMAATAGAVRSIVALNAEQMSLGENGRLQMEIDGVAIAAHTIESLFGRGGVQSLPGESACMGLVIEGTDGRAQVLCVRDVTEVIRTVVKPISPLLPAIPSVRGMTQLGDGRLAAVVDVAALLEQRGGSAVALVDSFDAALAALPRVVVADDSLSVRRALEQLMQDAGYDVAAARDGMEAVQMVGERTPVAVLLDLEMPRMNGLEVCRYLRSQPATRDVPVIMITSRASEKYRLMAEESGVTRLLGKPFSEDALVALVRELVADVANRHDEEVFL